MRTLSQEIERDTEILTKFAHSAVQAVRAERGVTPTPANPAMIGLSEGECSRYSLRRAINEIRPGNHSKRGSSLEWECHHELSKRFDVPLGHIAVPMDVLESRSMGSPSYLIGTGAPAGLSFIDMLRNYALAYRLGAQRLPGLQNDVAIPRQTANSSVTWLGPGGTVSATDGAFGQVSSSPRTACVITELTEQLLAQSSAEMIITRGLASDMAVGVDYAVINGAGGVQPLGLLNTPGIGTASGTTLGYSGLVGLQKTVADANASLNPASLAYATTPTVAELLKGRQRFSNTDSPCWEGAVHEGEIEGVKAVSSKQMPSATLLYGDWSSIFIGEWGPLFLSADNGGTRFNEAKVGIRALWLVDVFVTQPTAFVKVTSIT